MQVSNNKSVWLHGRKHSCHFQEASVINLFLSFQIAVKRLLLMLFIRAFGMKITLQSKDNQFNYLSCVKTMSLEFLVDIKQISPVKAVLFIQNI